MKRMILAAGLLLLVGLAAGCGPVPTAAPGQVGAGGQTAPVGQALQQLAQAQAALTQEAARQEAARQATEQANRNREFALQATAQAAQAAQDAARLRMEREAQGATLASRATADTLSMQGTQQAYTITATAAAIQATGQAAQMFATTTQSAAEAGKAAATAEYVRLQASQEAFLAADRTWAEHVVLRAAPTTTALAQQAHLENQTTITRWVTFALFLGILLLCGVAATLQLAYGSRIGEARARTAEQQAIEARMKAQRAAYVHLGNGQVLVTGEHPLVVDVQALAHLPAEAENGDGERINEHGEPERLESFLIRAARYAEEHWQSKAIPRHDRMRVSPESWMRFTDWLAEQGAVIKRERVGTFVGEAYGDLAGIYRAVNDGRIASTSPALPEDGSGWITRNRV